MKNIIKNKIELSKKLVSINESTVDYFQHSLYEKRMFLSDREIHSQYNSIYRALNIAKFFLSLWLKSNVWFNIAKVAYNVAKEWIKYDRDTVYIYSSMREKSYDRLMDTIRMCELELTEPEILVAKEKICDHWHRQLLKERFKTPYLNRFTKVLDL